jgi:tetratricopeptide (TPR) repeat protein
MRKKLIQLSLSLALLGLLVGCSSPEEKMAEFIRNGQALLEEQNYTKAALEFRNALQIDNNQVAAWYGLALIKEKQGEWKDAFGFLRKVVDIDPKHIDAQVKIGRFLLAAKQLDKAIEKAELVMKLAPMRADVRTLKAATLFKLDDIKGAEKLANAVLETEPQNVQALVILISIAIDSGDLDGALGYLNKGLAKDKMNVPLRLLKIDVLGKQKKITESANEFQTLISLYPETKNFRSALSRFYLVNQQAEKAEQVMRDMVKAMPTDNLAKLQLVDFIRKSQGTGAAIAQLQEFVKQQPAVYELSFALANLYRMAKQPDEAIATFKRIIASDQGGEQSLRAKNQLAVMALQAGDSAGALKLVQEVLTIESHHSDALLLRAAMRLQDNKAGEAIADLRTVLADDSRSVRALVILAKAHLRNGSPGLAKDNYKRAIAVNPANLPIVLEFAQILLQNKEESEAESLLQRYLDLKPNNRKALQAMAKIKLRKGDWIAAQDIADHLKRTGEQSAVVDQILGVALQGSNELEKSLNAFKRAHEAAPMAVRPLVALVQSYMRSNRAKDAQVLLESLTRSNPDNFLAHFLLGQVHLAGKDVGAAEESFKKAILHNPKWSVSHRTLAEFYQRTGQEDKVAKVFEDGLRELPEDINLNLSYATFLERKGDYELAINTYEKIIEINDKADVVANNLASLLSDHRTDADSLNRAFELASRFEKSQVPFFRDTIGWILHLQGKDKDATGHFEFAVGAKPDLGIFHYHLGVNLLALGKPDEARQALEKSVGMAKDGAGWAKEAKRILDSL